MLVTSARGRGRRQKLGFQTKFCLYCLDQGCNFWKNQGLPITHIAKIRGKKQQGTFFWKTTLQGVWRWWGRPPHPHPQAPREEFVGRRGWAWASGPVQHEPGHLWSIQPAQPYRRPHELGQGQSPQFAVLGLPRLKGHTMPFLTGGASLAGRAFL